MAAQRDNSVTIWQALLGVCACSERGAAQPLLGGLSSAGGWLGLSLALRARQHALGRQGGRHQISVLVERLVSTAGVQ
jgi:hypothetical protein